MKSHATIVGHVGNPGALKPVGDTQKLGFTVASNRRVKVDGQWTDKPTWWTVTVWGKRAAWLADKIRKGSAVTVMGEPHVEEWTTKEGDKRQTARIEADDVALHDRHDSAASLPGEAARPAPAAETGMDEAPF